MAGWTPKQILIGAIVVLAMLDCLGWAIATFYSWLLRDAGFFEPLSAGQVAENTQFAVIVSAVLLLNVAGTLAFIFSNGGYGLPVLAVVQGVDLVATLVLAGGHVTSLSSLVGLAVAPVLALVGLATLWRGFRQEANSP